MAGPRPTLTREQLRAHLRSNVFREGTADLVGAEIELIPLATTAGRVDIDASLARSDQLWASWPEAVGDRSEDAIPWRGGQLTREPGGQWEFSGPPLDTPEAAACAMERAVACLRKRARGHEFDFLAMGIHPWADTGSIDLHSGSHRYVAMQTYLDSIGPNGRRMMRLTASVQVAVDFGAGGEVAERWELAQRLAPVLTAAFANSAVSSGRPAAIPGLRASAWLGLDPLRTGFPARFLSDPNSSPIDQYLEFALEAPVMFLAREEGPYVVPVEPTSFANWMADGLPQGHPELADWDLHLSTLFPDVRPRGYLEVRAMDAPGIAWLGVPILLVGHAIRNTTSRRELLERLRPFHDELADLRIRAAEHALSDPTLRALALDLFAVVRRTLDGPAEGIVASYEERYIQPGITPGEELRARVTGVEELELRTLDSVEAERLAAIQRSDAPLAVTCP